MPQAAAPRGTGLARRSLLPEGMRALPGAARNVPLASLLLFFLALAGFASGGRLELDRAAVARGEVWRLVTGHWAHWTAGHLFWDSLAFFALAAACEVRISRRRLLTTVLGSALAVSAGVWLALPEIERYRGLSGIDSALFVLLAVSLLRETRNPWGGLALAAFLGKSAWEVWTGSTLFIAAGAFVPVPLAHLVGGAWGVIAGLVGIAGLPTHEHGKRVVGAAGGSSMKPEDQSGMQRQQSGGVSAGCWPVGQAAHRTLSQVLTLESTATHWQQFGGLRAAVCPSGHAAHRTFEQFPALPAAAVPALEEASEVPEPIVPDEPPPVPDVSVVAVPLPPPIVPSLPV